MAQKLTMATLQEENRILLDLITELQEDLTAVKQSVADLRANRPQAKAAIKENDVSEAVPALGAPLTTGTCETHGLVRLEKTGRCPTCTNAQRFTQWKAAGRVKAEVEAPVYSRRAA